LRTKHVFSREGDKTPTSKFFCSSTQTNLSSREQANSLANHARDRPFALDLTNNLAILEKCHASWQLSLRYTLSIPVSSWWFQEYGHP